MAKYDYSLTRRLLTIQSKLEPGFMELVSSSLFAWSSSSPFPECEKLCFIWKWALWDPPLFSPPPPLMLCQFWQNYCTCSRYRYPVDIGKHSPIRFTAWMQLKAAHTAYQTSLFKLNIYIWAILLRKLLIGRLVNRLLCHTNAQMGNSIVYRNHKVCDG